MLKGGELKGSFAEGLRSSVEGGLKEGERKPMGQETVGRELGGGATGGKGIG